MLNAAFNRDRAEWFLMHSNALTTAIEKALGNNESLLKFLSLLEELMEE